MNTLPENMTKAERAARCAAAIMRLRMEIGNTPTARGLREFRTLANLEYCYWIMDCYEKGE